MWELQDPKPVKLIIGILAADKDRAVGGDKGGQRANREGRPESDVWPFTQTDYYKDETGPNVLRQFVSIEKLIDPGKFAQIKHATNNFEQQIAGALKTELSAAGKSRPGIYRAVKIDFGHDEKLFASHLHRQ